MEEESDSGPAGEAESPLDAAYDVAVEIVAVLGTTSLPIRQILQLGRGAVVELDRDVSADIDIHANGHPIAKGEVVLVEDHFGVTLTKLSKGN